MPRKKRKRRLARSSPTLLSSAPMRYHFADCELDPRLYQLHREGTPIAVEPKVFDVLVYLLHHRDQVVSKDELLDKVWPGQVVSETALSRRIAAARRAVGDDGTKQEIIETHHGRGFRFIASVIELTEVATTSLASDGSSVSVTTNGQSREALFDPLPLPTEHEANEHAVSIAPASVTVPPAVAPAPVGTEEVPPHRVGRAHRSRFMTLAAILFLIVTTIGVVRYWPFPFPDTRPPTPSTQSLPLPDKPSIIVLPFTNLSGDSSQEYFSDGFTDELITDLSRIPQLFIIARQSAFTYKGKQTKVQDISREMGVRYVLEGSVQRTKEQLRVLVQLSDATTGEQVWAERYDRPMQDLFALQDDIVQKIVTTLKLQLPLLELGRIVHKGTNNLEAYDYFLRGQGYYFRYTKEASAQARQMYEKAIALDPPYADAYVWLGRAYNVEWGFRWNQDPKILERALALMHQALAIDDSLPRAHSFLGTIYADQQQYDQAIAAGERAIALDPNEAGSYASHGQVLLNAGRPEEAEKTLRQAMRLNPRSLANYPAALGTAYNLMGRYTEAISALKDALNRNPRHQSAYIDLATSYLQQWVSQQEENTQTLPQALAAAQRALALADTSPLLSSFGHVLLGYVYLLQKQYEPARTELEQAIANHPNSALGHAVLADLFGRVGKPDEALRMAEEALRRKPAMVDTHLAFVGSAYYFAGKPEEAIVPLKQYLSRYPNILGPHLALAAAYSELGKDSEAQAEVAEVLRINPNFSLEVHKERAPIKDPATLARVIAALRKAGLK
ncbi:MAG: tetratricopeptide repeat protein [Deltaproteobacteria bacterium]|nr:tetratricopeptide repeat protein [Deltaproteobacteria bacterium]